MRSLLIAALPLTLAAAPAPDSLTRTIVAVETARLAAFRAADRAAFDRLVTDDLTMTHSGGSVGDKADEIAVMRPSTPDRPLPTLALEDTRVRGYGNAAIMTGSLVERRDGQVVLRLRFTNTYIRQQGRWRLAAGQLTRDQG